jgi:aminopeptidase N
VKDGFVTASGRQVELGIYVEHGKEDRARPMRWTR